MQLAQNGGMALGQQGKAAGFLIVRRLCCEPRKQNPRAINVWATAPK